ncbi:MULTISPECIES: type I secretion system permease/ATPase [unclassified Neptuniibacter]|uniref:type I secretion system permease/ATPase n=1 Tax=unclassified Neptuniibacter TaxID=2630693 RepID=UPI000C47E76F|nr:MULTISPECIES: type I secretion system permease/ATPase [unclassified Neptuniibacter]MAY41480.1 type I secretion system permease/ATPase [Oceanospirillaceae bacterium]|tara:strand:+ start:14451 stop:16571 length:2121 start_codon:yes stop_codon:yes gene_type:complete
MEVVQDPLLGCLVHLSRQNHKPYSPEVLCEGLPLENHKLTPKLFIRAAKRAGFSAKVLSRSLEDISPLVLPAVLLLEGDQACILQEIDHETGQALIIQPESGGEHQVDLETLSNSYIGHAIFVRLEYRFQEQVSKLLEGHKGHWFWGTIKRSTAIYRDVLIASFLINLFVIANPLFVMNVYDRVVPNNAIETLWVLAIGVVVVYLFDFGLKMLRSYFIEVAGKKGDVILSALLFEKVLSLKYSVLPASVGSFASNLREFDSIKSFLSSTTNVVFIDLPFAILFLIVIGFIGGPIVIVPIVAIPLIILFSFIVRPHLKEAVEKTFASNSQKNATLIESLTAMETVKTQRATSSLQLSWEQAVGYIAKWSLKSRMLSASVVNFASFIQQLTSVGIIITGVYLISEHEMTMGALVACVMLSGRAISPMSQVANLVISYHQASTALKGLNEIMEMPSERTEGQKFVYRDELKGAIEFKDVSFVYPGEEQKALDRVSFNIKQGEKVALIGRIGSGKSSIEKLVLGLYEATEGSVRIDGLDINQIDPVDLRRNFGYMPQDIMLFAGSVRDNIVIGSPQTDDSRLVDVANMSGVSDMVNRHPQGFDMPVGERGASLSGGQRQSVAVARSIVHDPNLLVLDEPTASMDNASEEQIKVMLKNYTKDKTMLVVTHKMSLLTLVDRIIVMDAGRVVADGPKEAVLDALKQGRLQVQK